ncbi:MAG: polyphosphate polymerase domain-containing protein [Parabacteroides sp.]|nr:polyphosphate polymerase domain-containing protein [Parabacteroides sp.]
MEENVICSMLENFPSISLAEMDGVRLMNRVDTKYTTTDEGLKQFLLLLEKDYYVQEINGKRISPYRTVYLDTPGLAMYLAHQNGRRTREKIRMRSYIGSDRTFLEIKDKNNKGRTRKVRMPLTSMNAYLMAEADAFLYEHASFQLEDLQLQVENSFDRITLVNREKTERLTIDTNLHFRNLSSGREQSLPGLVIIELKQDGNIPSRAKSYLSQLHIHPVSISKYCLGTLLTNPSAKHNRFKKKLTQINKLANYSYGYIF